MKEEKARELFPSLIEFDKARHKANHYRKKGHTYGYQKWKKEKRVIFKNFKNKYEFSDLIQSARFYGLTRELKVQKAKKQSKRVLNWIKKFVKNAVKKILTKGGTSDK